MHKAREVDQEQVESGIVRAQIRTRPLLQCGQVEYHFVNPRGKPTPALSAAFSVWYDVWTDTMSELEGVPRIYADEFTRQDEMGVMMSGDECISIIGFRFVNLALPQFREDSYFVRWPTTVLDQLAGRWLCLMDNVTIAPAWRGGLIVAPDGGATESLAVKHMVSRMSLRRFLHGRAEGLIGSPRRDRNLHRVAYDLGARKLAEIEVHGVETDLIIFERSEIVPLGDIVEDVWSRRVEEPNGLFDV